MSLNEIARALVAAGKGILAADESTGTIQKRLESVGVESSEETRRTYRELLFTASGIEQYISGVILYDETIRQRSSDGHTFVTVLERKNILPGIKVDMGTELFEDSKIEKYTKGLDGLDGRLKQYLNFGARFAKWRAVYTITEDLPSEKLMLKNAQDLAKYAYLCQQNSIVPIVEPEVLMDGQHDIKHCYDITQKVLARVFDELRFAGVQLDSMLLKPNMVIPGMGSAKAAPTEVAQNTLNCFKEVVPYEVPGIVFLSGGQSEEEACANLNAINIERGSHPWELSFSYGRALQASTLKAWSGKGENIPKAQEVFLHRARLTSAARSGTYNADME